MRPMSQSFSASTPKAEPSLIEETNNTPARISTMTCSTSPQLSRWPAPFVRLVSPEMIAANCSTPSRSRPAEPASRNPSELTAMASRTPTTSRTKFDSSQLKFRALPLNLRISTISTITIRRRQRSPSLRTSLTYCTLEPCQALLRRLSIALGFTGRRLLGRRRLAEAVAGGRRFHAQHRAVPRRQAAATVIGLIRPLRCPTRNLEHARPRSLARRGGIGVILADRVPATVVHHRLSDRSAAAV